MAYDPFELLKSLYKTMDSSWNKIAARYHFTCNGCEDNCCRSLFFHHTHVEKAYLLKGFHILPDALKKEISIKAAAYCEKTFSNPSEIKSGKIYCPVNKGGSCLLYDYRPMICRLHGLPHELNRPGFSTLMGKGCDAGLFDDKPYIKFDRTPFYQQMAQAELLFRKNQNKGGKIKETIAQMLVSE